MIEQRLLPIGYSAQQKFTCVGRNIFSPGPGRVQELANGKSLWIGTFLSVRIGWTIRLNLDVANRPAYEEGTVWHTRERLGSESSSLS